MYILSQSANVAYLLQTLVKEYDFFIVSDNATCTDMNADKLSSEITFPHRQCHSLELIT